MVGKALRPLPLLIFGSRWLQLPLYLGLVVLGLVDVVMISNLLIMVIVGGYETFVSRLELEGHPDQPEWLSHVNASVLKIKRAMAIIGISSIHLLRTFIEAGDLDGIHFRWWATRRLRRRWLGRTIFTETGIMWQTIIHCVFVLSAIGVAAVERITTPRPRNTDLSGWHAVARTGSHLWSFEDRPAML